MKKKELRSGMMIQIKNQDEKSLVLINDEQGGNTTCNLMPELCNRIVRHVNYYGLDNYNEDLTSCNSVTGDIIAVYGMYGDLLWERQPEKIIKFDGVEYSESTLRSLIKKATE